jgi:glycosyltransferase involved in cell wall biosynthesis
MSDSVRPKRIVLVAMADSIHVARWTEQFSADEYSFWLFPSTPNRRVHRRLQNRTNIKIFGLSGRLSFFLWGADLLLMNNLRAFLLSRLIQKVQPDHVHALEFQHGAYLAEHALRKIKGNVSFIATNYGSDIYWFKRYAKHETRIKSVLARADKYSAECERDIELAKSMGFVGKSLPVIPNAGGLEVQELQVLKPLDRTTIAIKGYENWVGRAVNIVRSLPLLETELSDFNLVFYSCNWKTLRALRRLKVRTRLNVQAYRKKTLSHEQMLTLFGKSLVYVGVSLSDGISTSMSEAIAMGAFPIQTNTACTNEWFEDGFSGIALKSAESSEIAQALSKGISMARARTEVNFANDRSIALGKLNRESVQKIARKFYD